jgi:formate hydrogenlyase subunit 6/NADH:ubiquinone oxidoreductase subunit I
MLPRQQELHVLKQQARAIETRIHLLENGLRRLEQGRRSPRLRAQTDPEKCVGCGICREVCPTGAVSLEQTARVDPSRCIGCGRCVEACPREAIRLYPARWMPDQRARPVL